MGKKKIAAEPPPTKQEKREFLREDLSDLGALLGELREMQRRFPDHAARIVAILEAMVDVNASPVDRASRITSHNRLNALLSSYKWTAFVFPMWDGSSEARYHPDPIRTSDAGLQWERNFVETILFHLRNMQSMPYLARCESCRSFLVARTAKGKRFCDARCKQRDFDSKPENREQKRATMKKNYEQRKRDDARVAAAALQGRSAAKRRAVR